MELIIGNKCYSSWSLRAWLLLRHFCIPFEERRIMLYTDSSRDELLELSPTGMVPVRKDRGVTVWDSLAIMDYLEDIRDDHSIWPVERVARAHARSISAEMHSGFATLREKLPMNCKAEGRAVEWDDAVSADIARIQQIWTNARKKHGEDGPWLFGAFSAADAMFAPVVLRFASYRVQVSNPVADYMAHVMSDAHIREWILDGQAETEVIETSEVGG